MLRELYSAVLGGGARLNGRVLTMNPDWTVASTTTGFGATQKAPAPEVGAFVEALYRAGGVLFRVGSGALMLAYVAANGWRAITTRRCIAGTAGPAWCWCARPAGS